MFTSSRLPNLARIAAFACITFTSVLGSLPAAAQTLETQSNVFSTEVEAVNPNIRIDIPGLDKGTLNASGIVKGDGKNGCPEGKICVRTIAVYLNALYKFFLSSGVIIAIVLVMIGGIQWMVGATVGSHEKAHERIEHALIGLALLFGTYAILTFINPAITSLKPLELDVIRAPEHIAPSVLSGGDPVQMNFKKLISVDDIPKEHTYSQRTFTTDEILQFTGEERLIHQSVVEPLLNAAAGIKISMGTGMLVTSAARSIYSQINLLVERCMLGKTCPTNQEVCNPFKYAANSPIEGSASKGYQLKAAYRDDYKHPEEVKGFLINEANNIDRIGCPHNTGAAVDVWCQGESSDKTNVQCHTSLEVDMKSAGFARIYNEGWHFELKSMANSPAAKANDWTIGEVIANEGACVNTSNVKDTPSNLYQQKTLLQKNYCVFQYSECPTKYAKIKGSADNLVRCIAE